MIPARLLSRVRTTCKIDGSEQAISNSWTTWIVCEADESAPRNTLAPTPPVRTAFSALSSVVTSIFPLSAAAEPWVQGAIASFFAPAVNSYFSVAVSVAGAGAVPFVGGGGGGGIGTWPSHPSTNSAPSVIDLPPILSADDAQGFASAGGEARQGSGPAWTSMSQSDRWEPRPSSIAAPWRVVPRSSGASTQAQEITDDPQMTTKSKNRKMGPNYPNYLSLG